MRWLTSTVLLLLYSQRADALQSILPFQSTLTKAKTSNIRTVRTQILAESAAVTSAVENGVNQLKRTLEREYASFFSPMERGGYCFEQILFLSHDLLHLTFVFISLTSEYYAEGVTFDDPMTNLEGVDAYQKNVDMLSGKNIIGKILFRDAGIVLHNIDGGEIKDDGSINDIITRWTLRMTFQALPWQPTARFSGISIYNVRPGGPKGVQVVKQTDFWDSINIAEGGQYKKVETGKAIAHFLDQLKPDQFAAPSAGTELPYQLLRRGSDYEVRRYPSFVAVKTAYERRDEGFTELGAFSSGMDPLAPALMTVTSSAEPKYMMWPLGYTKPGFDAPAELQMANEKAAEKIWKTCEIVSVPERVVAVGSFSDASVEPVVRKADKVLRESCGRDGLTVAGVGDGAVTFAQYDAVYSMGKRRGEVWIELEESGHPWARTL